MAKEIERKFLVHSFHPSQGDISEVIIQGYLSTNEEATVRVRLIEGWQSIQAFLTIKGKTQGISRSEYEYSIPVADGEDLLELCENVLTKTRFYHGPWEIDMFHGRNDGLIIAEIELESEDANFEKPDWVGEEVSHDHRYFNSNLSVMPFKDWGEWSK